MSNDTTSESRAWYDKKRFLIPLLVFVFPVGLYALWKNNDFSRRAKLVIGGATLLFAIFAVASENPNPISTQTAVEIPEGVSYPVENTDIVSDHKRGLEVRLNKRVSEDVLRAIALELKKRDSREYDRTFIDYYLPDMELGAGAWATTHFNPDLEVRILGLSKEQEAALSEIEDSDRDVMSGWLEDTFTQSRYLLFRENGRLFMERTFGDGSSRVMEVVEKQSPHGRRLDRVEETNTDDYWVIDESGNLQLRDSEGLVTTAEKIE